MTVTYAEPASSSPTSTAPLPGQDDNHSDDREEEVLPEVLGTEQGLPELV